MSYNNIQRDKFIPFWHTGNYIHIVHEKIIPVPLTVLGCEKYWNVIFFMNEIVNIIIIIKYIKPHWVASWTFQIKMLPKLKWDTKRRQLWPALASSYIQFCIALSARLLLPSSFFTVNGHKAVKSSFPFSNKQLNAWWGTKEPICKSGSSDSFVM